MHVFLLNLDTLYYNVVAKSSGIFCVASIARQPSAKGGVAASVQLVLPYVNSTPLVQVRSYAALATPFRALAIDLGNPALVVSLRYLRPLAPLRHGSQLGTRH
jgi:hypothetical protein